MIIIQLQMCELKLPCHDRHKHVTDHDVKLAIMPSSTTVHIVVFGNINHIKSGCSFTEPFELETYLQSCTSVPGILFVG